MTDPEYDDDSVIVPFVLTKKHGGEYDDEAFNAGWHMASLESRLTTSEASDLLMPPVVLRTKWKEQADLIAMSHSLLVKMVPTDQPDYSVFIFGTPEFFETEEDEA